MIRNAFLLASALTVAMLASCSGRPNANSNPHMAAPSMQAIGNAVFSDISGATFRLTDGRWEGENYLPGGASRPSAALLPDKYIVFRDGGTAEAAVILWHSSGGSGRFFYLAIAAWQGSSVAIVDTVLLGDRVKIEEFRRDGGNILVQLLQHGADDAACCPTQRAIRRWSRKNATLTELQS